MPKDRPKDLLIIFCVSAFLLLAGLIMAVKYSGKPFLTENLSQLAQTADAGITRVLHVDANASSSDGDGSESRPFKTIQSAVNVATAGTKILVKAGRYPEKIVSRVSGTASNPIIIEGEVGPGGEKLVTIEGGTVINNWQPAPEIGSGVYKASFGEMARAVSIDGKYLDKIKDIPDSINNPPNMKDGTWRAYFTSDLNFEATPDNLEHIRNSGGNPDTARKIKFWDVTYGMFGYLDGVVYVRLKDKSSPNNYVTRVAGNETSVIFYDGSYVTMRNFKIEGAWSGIAMSGSGVHHITIENNYINTTNNNVAIISGASNNIVRNNEITRKRHGGPSGAWNGVSDNPSVQYDLDLKQAFYQWDHHWIFNSGSGLRGVNIGDSAEYNEIYGNKIHGLLLGISNSGSRNTKIYNNEISNQSSVGLLMYPGSIDVEIYGNIFRNNNINIRNHQLSESISRKYYIYNNWFIGPPATGVHLFFHWYTGSSMPPVPQIYIYHNNFVGARNAISLDNFAKEYNGVPGVHVLNNIFSTSNDLTGASLPESNFFGSFDYNSLDVLANTYKTRNWFGSRNIINTNIPFFNINVSPDTALTSGSPAFGAGIDLSKTQVINGKTIGPLPGMSSCPSGQPPHMGVFGCPGSSGGSTPVNGACSTVLNSCNAGSLSDTADSSTHHLWQCVGQNGGSTASCSQAKQSSSSPVQFHVAPNGNDINAGSLSAPVATMERALALFNAQPSEGEIILRGGIYNLTREVLIRPNSANTARLTIKPATGENPIFDGSVVASVSPLNGEPGIYILSASYSGANLPQIWEEIPKARYTSVPSMDILRHTDYGAFAYAPNQIAIRSRDGNNPSAGNLKVAKALHGFQITRSNTEIRGLHFRGFGLNYSSAGVMVGANNNSQTIDNISILDTYVENSYSGFFTLKGTLINRVEIKRCKTRDVATGVNPWGGNVTVENCDLRNDDRPSNLFAFKNPDNQTGGFGIRVHDNYGEYGTYRYNLIKGFPVGFHLGSSAGTGNYLIEHNTIVDRSYEYNNNSASRGIFWARYSYDCNPCVKEKAIFRYNIVDGFKISYLLGNSKTTAIMEKNIFWNSKLDQESYVASALNAGLGENINSDPLFVNLGAEDFRVYADSPAVGIASGGSPAGAMGATTENSPAGAEDPPQQDPGTFTGRVQIAYSRANQFGFVVFSNNPYADQYLSYRKKGLTSWTKGFDTSIYRSLPYDDLKKVGEQPMVAIGLSPDTVYEYMITPAQGEPSPIYEIQTTGASKTYYVSPTGSNSRSRGGVINPFRTVQYAIDMALPGDTIILKPGVYKGPFVFFRGGVAGYPITVKSEGTTRAILSGDGLTSRIITLINVSNVKLDNFEIQYAKNTGLWCQVCRDIEISNNIFANGPVGTRNFFGGAVVVRDSDTINIHHNLIYSWWEGITFNNSPRTKIRSNTIVNIAKSGIEAGYGSTFARMIDTEIMYNTINFFANTAMKVHVKPEEKAQLRINYNNYGTLITTARGTPDADSAFAKAYSYFPSSRELLYLNNIGSGSKIYVSFREWKSETGFDTNSIFADPLWIEPLAVNFYLKPGSPNVLSGGAVIGAFGLESSGGTTPPQSGVNGVCGSGLNACISGNFFDTQDASTHYLWSCLGIGGGSSASCTLSKQAQVHGSCSATLNQCSAGTYSDLSDSSSEYRWYCIGLNGGNSTVCRSPIPGSAPTPPMSGQSNPDLRVSIEARPSSGEAPQEYVSVIATISGYISRTVDYYFYCNRPESSLGIVRPSDGYYGLSASKSQIHNCSYREPGEYTPKVIADFGNGSVAEARATVVVLKPGSSTAGAGGSASVYLSSAPRFGQSGEDVLKLQRLLARRGHLPENLMTGYFGSITLQAVADFKRSANVTLGVSDGIVDANTLKAINYFASLYPELSSGASPASSGEGYLRSTLALGQRGSEVVKLQRFLIQAGYLSSDLATGYFGTLTSSAVRSFKARTNVPTSDRSSGNVDEATRKAINTEATKYPALLSPGSAGGPVSPSPNPASPAPAPLSGPIPAITSALSYGSEGAQVIALQRVLVKENLLSSSDVVGYFGTKTLKAVRDFQRKYSITTPLDPAYGMVGPKTRVKLNELR